jgi:hypothetical protein
MIELRSYEYEYGDLPVGRFIAWPWNEWHLDGDRRRMEMDRLDAA